MILLADGFKVFDMKGRVDAFPEIVSILDGGYEDSRHIIRGVVANWDLGER